MTELLPSSICQLVFESNPFSAFMIPVPASELILRLNEPSCAVDVLKVALLHNISMSSTKHISADCMGPEST